MRSAGFTRANVERMANDGMITDSKSIAAYALLLMGGAPFASCEMGLRTSRFGLHPGEVNSADFNSSVRKKQPSPRHEHSLGASRHSGAARCARSGPSALPDRARMPRPLYATSARQRP